MNFSYKHLWVKYWQQIDKDYPVIFRGVNWTPTCSVESLEFEGQFLQNPCIIILQVQGDKFLIIIDNVFHYSLMINYNI